jgi:hypothetical protein
VVHFRIPPWLQYLFPKFFCSSDSDYFPSNNTFSNSNTNPDVDDDTLPPLEEIELPDSLKPENQIGKEWFVFHPVFGVIPSETRDLWLEQEWEREDYRHTLLEEQSRKRLPPVRFSDEQQEEEEEEGEYQLEEDEEEEFRRETNNNNRAIPTQSERRRVDDDDDNEDDEKELFQNIPMERTISGFDVVGIE